MAASWYRTTVADAALLQAIYNYDADSAEGDGLRPKSVFFILVDDRAELEVEFRIGEKVTLYYSLAKEHGGWRVEESPTSRARSHGV
ncbi:hypothetical protein RHEC894_CH02612 [Rhizobium sp. CIAT894]|uniref:hypothetical protein n=1 Tax=Rhizobium sp. CIAT894 TaxID=2020312 RepID=UPI000190840A|nr:hypothetical protein [Rhizobium sp. CIAT894]ARM88900.1 hypothetical protein RHEC894_CH02612 [Rhizobium sp. CIAT894]